jgi:hypothetical protein
MWVQLTVHLPLLKQPALHLLFTTDAITGRQLIALIFPLQYSHTGISAHNRPPVLPERRCKQGAHTNSLERWGSAPIEASNAFTRVSSDLHPERLSFDLVNREGALKSLRL